MKFIFGTDSITKNINDLGVTSIGDIAERFSDVMGFDPSNVEYRVNGVCVGADYVCSDATEISASPKANQKG